MLKLQRSAIRRAEAMPEKMTTEPSLAFIMVMSLAAWSPALYLQFFFVSVSAHNKVLLV